MVALQDTDVDQSSSRLSWEEVCSSVVASGSEIGLSMDKDIDAIFSQIPCDAGSLDVSGGRVGEERFVIATDADVRECQESVVSCNTKKSTNWSVNVWKELSTSRRKRFRDDPFESPPHLMICSSVELNQWLCKFVIEVRRYPPNSLYQLCCGIIRYVREKKPAINFFTDEEFAGFWSTLDGVKKKLQREGWG